MVGNEGARQSGKGDDEARGLLFRICTRLGLVLFAAVLFLSVDAGAAFGTALLRGLGALLALAACGWIAEKIAGAGRPHTADEGAAEQFAPPPAATAATAATADQPAPPAADAEDDTAAAA